MLLILAAALAAAPSQPVDVQSTAQSAVHPHPMAPRGGPGMGQMKPPTAAERQEMWTRQFQAVDTNHDGQISQKEFSAAAEKAFAEREAIMRKLMAMRQAQMQGRSDGAARH